MSVLSDRIKFGYLAGLYWPLRNTSRRAYYYLRWQLPLKFTPWIHMPSDGRPMPRKAYVNGELMNLVIYADLRKGFIRQNIEPAHMNRRKNGVRWRKRRGEVVIQYEDGHIE